jgi:hypothetical protein
MLVCLNFELTLKLWRRNAETADKASTRMLSQITCVHILIIHPIVPTQSYSEKRDETTLIEKTPRIDGSGYKAPLSVWTFPFHPQFIPLDSVCPAFHLSPSRFAHSCAVLDTYASQPSHSLPLLVHSVETSLSESSFGVRSTAYMRVICSWWCTLPVGIRSFRSLILSRCHSYVFNSFSRLISARVFETHIVLVSFATRLMRHSCHISRPKFSVCALMKSHKDPSF